MNRGVFFLLAMVSWHGYSQTKVGIGTNAPMAPLHIISPDWVKTLYQTSDGTASGYVGLDGAGTFSLTTNAVWDGSQWQYPQPGTALIFSMNRASQQFEFRVRPNGGNQITPMVIGANGRVGIGTTTPQQMLSVQGGMNVDQGNTGNGTVPSLRLGSNSGEGIGSKRNSGSGQFGLDFFTNNQLRMRIFNNGRIAVGDVEPLAQLSLANDLVVNQNETITGMSLQFGQFSGVGIGSRKTGGSNPNGLDFYTNNQIAMSISNGGNMYLGFPGTTDKLNIAGNATANRISGTDLFVDRNNVNTGTWGNNDPAIRFGTNSGEGISSKRTAGDRQYALDFFTNGQRRMSVLNNGNVEVVGNLTVQNGKGIIRSADAQQRKKVVGTVTISGQFISGETRTFSVTFPEPFSSPPDAWIGNMVTGVGGWAEVLLTITDITNTGCTVWAHNLRFFTVSPNFTMKVIAIGPQ
ncbi:MAG: hypothetical protein MUE71_06625 [Chitinophagaceae bacterium]|nr:hypothetical protein [Chitinophagaceae bacterium]